ncbi:MAG TPA: RagB/SusD family nutrient uptake outer membrane protein, partial [Puia sp.]|nr:RagB/SusD family nutrient uptake outer membrane protein [Puia sp.]
NTAEGYQFVPSSASIKPSYGLSSVVLAAFEPGDQRRLDWVDSNKIAGTVYYYPYKYKTRLATPALEYYVVLRLGEQYLIEAEAEAQLGSLTAAIASLDKIRVRAGLPAVAQTNPGIGQADLLAAIDHENQVEFFCEWGHRWFDLKRLGRINAVLGAEKPAVWHPTDALYPIPNNEILTNPNITQNAGY